MQTFSFVVNKYTGLVRVRFVVVYIFFLLLWFNIFYLTLSVGLSPRVQPKGKRGFEKNETSQPAGTVHEM